MKAKFVASVARFESIVFELRAMFDLNDEYEKRDAPQFASGSYGENGCEVGEETCIPSI